MTTRPGAPPVACSAFAGFYFPPDVIVLAVRWYLRFALSYRDVEELLAERGIEVDHVTVYRWVQRFTPLLAEAARPCRHAVGDHWQVDETDVKSPAVGATSLGRSTRQARSSMCSCPHIGTQPRPAASANRPSRRPGHSDGGRHRPHPGLPDGVGRPARGDLAPHRAVRQQPS